MKVFVKLFAKKNLGDDLFLKILLERYPDHIFTIIASEDYKKIFSNYDNLEVINDSNLDLKSSFSAKIISFLKRKLFPKFYSSGLRTKLKLKFKETFMQYDCFVSIGGSIFMQPKVHPAYIDVEYYKLVIESFTKVFFLGCNFGPHKTDDYVDSYSQIFKKSTDVCFRDSKSKSLFSELDNVRCHSDIVFDLNVPNVSRIENSIGFSIISPRNNVDRQLYIKKYAELIEECQSRGLSVYLISFCSIQNDDKTIDSIIELLSDRNVNRLFYDGDINSFLEVYGSIESIFCGRFHAIILSLIFKQKILPVVYSSKMTNVLSDLGYTGTYVHMNKFAERNTSQLLDEIKSNSCDVEAAIIDSKRQFSKLDLILNDL